MHKNNYLFQRLEKFSLIVENIVLKINKNQEVQVKPLSTMDTNQIIT